MAPQSRFIVSLTIIFSVCILYPSVASAISPELTKKVCNSQEILSKGVFCMKTLTNPSVVAASKDLIQLTAAVMKLASANAKKTLGFITAELAKKPTSPKVVDTLKVCKDYYKYAIRSFNMIPSEVTEDAMSANYDVGVIGSTSNDCVNSVKANNVQIPQLLAGNESLNSFSALGAAITDKVQQLQV